MLVVLGDAHAAYVRDFGLCGPGLAVREGCGIGCVVCGSCVGNRDDAAPVDRQTVSDRGDPMHERRGDGRATTLCSPMRWSSSSASTSQERRC